MQPQSDSAKGAKNQKTKKIVRIAVTSIVAVVIFLFGVGVGKGDVLFGTPTNTANKALPENLDYAQVEQVYDMLKSHYDGTLSTEQLIDGLKTGLAQATGDPYTQYFNKADAKKFNDELNGSFTGIGAELDKDKNGNLIIVAPIEGFPASKAGLRPQDVIVSIDGTTTSGMTVDEAVSRIRGEKDTKVTLRILRDKKDDLSFTIVRDKIKISSVTWEMLDNKIGYIRVSQFGEDTSGLMRQAAEELKSKGVQRILLDLRGNPGGLLTSAIDMSSLWLEKGKTVLQEKRGGVVTETYTSDGAATFKNVPTAVLINAGSASASEIVAGALRDNHAATVFGEKSFGKGSVQELLVLPNGSELKVTVARWYRPNGQNIDKKGIKPDHEVTRSNEDFEQKRDPQKDAALTFLKSK